MRWVKKTRLRLRSLFRKSAVDAELNEELRFHVEHEIARNEEAGMSNEEAEAVEKRARQARPTGGAGWRKKKKGG